MEMLSPIWRKRSTTKFGGLVALFRRTYRVRTGPLRVAPRFPGDSPFDQNVTSRLKGESPNGPNGTNLLRRRLWMAVAGAGTFLIGVVILPNLEKTPISQRWRLMLVSRGQETMLGAMAAESLIQQNASLLLPPNDPNVLLVHKVTRRIVSAALVAFPELFPPGASLHDVLQSFPIRVIKSSMVNASVLPGARNIHPSSHSTDGSIFVFSGILPIAREEAGLATVLSHEIAHKLLRHHGERMSLYAMLLYFGILGQIAMGGDSFIRSVNDLLMKIGILLPNSRKTEMEADHIGLLLMAAACYDPKHAISFWHRMDKAAKSDSHGQSEKNTTIGQFLSTHPSHGRRSDHLEEKMPMAIRIWEKANCDEQVNPFWQRFRYGSGSPGGWSQW